MFLIALTGGIAAGKSTVAALLREHGAFEIDADQVAREVSSKGSEGLDKIVSSFGERVLDSSKGLDRKKLAEIIFGDPAKRELLESILHPLIRSRTAELIRESTKPIVVYSVPLLVESGVDHQFDLVVTVEAGESIREQRLISSRGLTLDQAKQRISAQASSAERRSRADVVLDSSGSLDELKSQVDKLWQEISELADRKQGIGKN
jgi:dephospho-CoA kinase